MDRQTWEMANDRSRVSFDGARMGAKLAKLTDKAVKKLELQGEKDERCATCAFRLGTVPNGCIQTQSEAWKATLEDKTFLCHHDDRRETVCHGHYAIRQAMRGSTIQCPWDYWPQD